MSSYDLKRQAEVAARLREALRGQIDEDDDDLWQGMVEGETDLLELVRKAVDASDEDLALADLAKQRQQQIAAREARLRDRAKRTRAMISEALGAAGLKRVTYEDMTLSCRSGSQSVDLADPDQIPALYMREKRSCVPDKAEIKRALERGEQVPGARLVTGDPGLTVRRT